MGKLALPSQKELADLFCLDHVDQSAGYIIVQTLIAAYTAQHSTAQRTAEAPAL